MEALSSNDQSGEKLLKEGNQHGGIEGCCRSKLFLLRGTNIYCGITVLKGRAHHGGQYSKGSLIRHHCCFPLLTSSSSSSGKACVV